jgi:plastocyanin
MRKLLILAAVSTVAFGLVGVGPASAKSSNPVSLSGKVNAKGTKDLSGKSSATLTLEADDFYFSPTFVKVKPGEKVTITFKNEGKATHTFTSTGLSIDQQVSAGKSTKFTLTVPSTGDAFQFHCNFHKDMGMQGAFYTKAGGKVTAASNTATPTSRSSMGY